MEYIISFLEGIITFISPCLLPMLPIYISYFAGGDRSSARTLKGAVGFVLGFTAVFVAMGALAGTLGSFLQRYKTWVDLVCGGIVIVFGLSYLGLLRISLFRGGNSGFRAGQQGFFSAVLFGVVFSVGWTPCVGAFLGSALMLASQQGTWSKGVCMLLCYSMGLGVPFLISAVLIDRLKTTFDWIKRHYGIINKVCGVLLICVGVLMATGLLGLFLNALS